MQEKPTVYLCGESREPLLLGKVAFNGLQLSVRGAEVRAELRPQKYLGVLLSEERPLYGAGECHRDPTAGRVWGQVIVAAIFATHLLHTEYYAARLYTFQIFFNFLKK